MPVIKYVYKPKRKGKRSEPNYYGRYKIPGAKLQDVPLQTTDKRIAQKRLDDIVERAVKIAGGENPPPVADVKPLRVHLEDWLKDLEAKKNSEKYISNMGYRIRKIAAECQWVYAQDVTRDSFSRWRAEQNLSAKTINDYQDAVCALFSWMNEMERTTENPLKRLSGVVTAGNEKRKRRAFTLPELMRLKEVCGRRWMVYMAAILTGLRRGELSKLVWNDVHLDHDPPYIAVQSSTTKNRKPAFFVLRPDMVEMLKEIRPANAPPMRRVFYRMVPGMDTFKEDLKKAGIAFVDDAGRRADFHAMRHTTGTELAKAGITERTAMEFMRHSDPKLTRKIYTDVTQLPTAGVMHLLPALTEQSPDKENEMRSQTLVTSGQCLANNGIICQLTKPPENSKTPAKKGVLNVEVASSAGRTRTYFNIVSFRLKAAIAAEKRSHDLRRRQLIVAALFLRAANKAEKRELQYNQTVVNLN
jgi:integrase